MVLQRGGGMGRGRGGMGRGRGGMKPRPPFIPHVPFDIGELYAVRIYILIPDPMK